MAVAILGIVAAAGCSSERSTEGQSNEALLKAIGLWETTKDTVAPGELDTVPFQIDGQIFVGTLSTVEMPEGLDCATLEDYVSATLKVHRLNREVFELATTIELRDTWADALKSGDVTSDGRNEILVESSCYGGSSITGFTLFEDKWTEIDLAGASTFENGILLGISKDCVPSCADSGVEYRRYEWNGVSIVEAGLVNADGTPVELAVTTTCDAYREAVALPLRMCDEGPLVEQFLLLANNIGDYSRAGGIVSDSSDRLTPSATQWVNVYRYRQGLAITPTVDGELFADLGESFAPDSSSPQAQKFERYCIDERWPECFGYRYLFPTEECPAYRSDLEFPLKACDFGSWVILLEQGLNSADGKTATAEPEDLHLIDEAMVARIRAVQSSRNLKATGVVDVATWKALFGSADPTTAEDMNGDGVYGPGDIIPH